MPFIGRIIFHPRVPPGSTRTGRHDVKLPTWSGAHSLSPVIDCRSGRPPTCSMARAASGRPAAAPLRAPSPASHVARKPAHRASPAPVCRCPAPALRGRATVGLRHPSSGLLRRRASGRPQGSGREDSLLSVLYLRSREQRTFFEVREAQVGTAGPREETVRPDVFEHGTADGSTETVMPSPRARRRASKAVSLRLPPENV